jgi:hypothetical protein
LVVGDVVDDLDDPAVGEWVLRCVFAGDGVAAVVPDAEAFAAEGVAAGLRAEPALVDLSSSM